MNENYVLFDEWKKKEDSQNKKMKEKIFFLFSNVVFFWVLRNENNILFPCCINIKKSDNEEYESNFINDFLKHYNVNETIEKILQTEIEQNQMNDEKYENEAA